MLELGAGAAALPSIVAARGGAKNVLATDGLEDGGLFAAEPGGSDNEPTND